MRDFYQEIIDIIGSGGEACCVFPAGDPLFENAAHTTFTTKGTGALDGLVCTYGPGTRNNFDLPVGYFRNQFRVPRLNLNAVDEWFNTPDIAAFSRDDTGSNPMSMGGLISPSSAGTNRAILSKMGANGAEEWIVRLNASNKLRAELIDDSANITIDRTSDDGIAIQSSVVFGVTYDANASAKSAAADDLTLYSQGAVLVSTATNNASYVGMEALAAEVYGGARERNSVTFEFGDWISALWFSQRLVTAAEMRNLNDIYVAMQRADRSRLLAGVI